MIYINDNTEALIEKMPTETASNLREAIYSSDTDLIVFANDICVDSDISIAVPLPYLADFVSKQVFTCQGEKIYVFRLNSQKILFGGNTLVVYDGIKLTKVKLGRSSQTTISSRLTKEVKSVWVNNHRKLIMGWIHESDIPEF